MLNGKVSPSVHIVYIRTFLNGWIAARRMRFLAESGLSDRCVLCHRGMDSIEHLPHCIIIKDFYRHLGINMHNLESFLALDQRQFPEMLPAIAEALAAIYLARNAIMHSPSNLFNPLELVIQMPVQLNG